MRRCLLALSLAVVPARGLAAAVSTPAVGAVRGLVLDALAAPLDAPPAPDAALPLHPALDEKLTVFLQRAAELSAGQEPAQAVASPARAAAGLAAVSRELSRYDAGELASMPAEDVERLAGRVMDGLGLEAPAPAAAPAAGDLPPTSGEGLGVLGLTRALTPPKERPLPFPETGMLGKILLTPDYAMGAAVERMLAEQPKLSRTLFDLFASLRGVVDGPGSNGERAATALALRDKFAAFLRAVRSPGRELVYRVAAGRALHRMLLSGALLEELFRARAVSDQSRALRAALDAAAVTPEIRAREHERPSLGGWRLPGRRPQSKRVSDPAATSILYGSAADKAARASWHAFLLERQARRAALTAADPRFSAAFRRKHRRRFERLYLETARFQRWLDDSLAGHVGNRVLNQFIAPAGGERPWAPLHVPKNLNLALTLEEGGFVLRATLTTDIQEPAVAAYVKASIEDYWRGGVPDSEGNLMPFRTELTVRRLAPGEAFAPTDLRLVETADHGDYGTERGIGLSRLGMAWGTIAHEFGHVLGLPDEYRISYDARARKVRQTSSPGSLMSDGRQGVLQPRHFANVVNLLAHGGRFSDAREAR